MKRNAEIGLSARPSRQAWLGRKKAYDASISYAMEE